MNRMFPMVCLVTAAFTTFAGREIVGAFPNGEFDDRTKFGKESANVEYLPTCGLNGSSGVRLRPKSLVDNYENFEFRVPFAFLPKRGQKYALTVCRRIVGNLRVTLVWQYWKKGWCLGQSHNNDIEKLDGGWERMKNILHYTDPEWEGGEFRILVMVHVPRQIKQTEPDLYVDLDCAAIAEDEPEWHLANVWPTHNHVYGDSGRVRFHSGFVGHVIPEGGVAAYRCRLLAPDGKELAKRTLKPDSQTFTVDLGAVDYAGPARLEVSIADTVSRKPCGRKLIDVTVRPAPKPGKNDVVITESGDTLVDGRKFMPLGFYTGFGNKGHPNIERARRELKRISEAGFNCIMEYWITTWEARNTEAFIAALRENDIRLLYNMTAGARGEIEPCLKRARTAVEKGYPILAWYTLDEAEFKHLPNLRRLRRELNALTPTIPTWQVNIREVEPYMDVADVYGGDNYLIGRHQGCLKYMDKALALAQSCQPATMWFCPQCFNWANYTPSCLNDREKYIAQDIEPTVEAMLAIAFVHASHGAKGFVFYLYDEIFNGPVPELYEKRWEDVKRVGRVLKSLEPFILSGRPIVDLPVRNVKGKTHAAMLTDEKGRHRVLITGLDYENEAEIAVPEDCADLTPLFGHVSKPAAGFSLWPFKAGLRSCDLLK